MENDSTEPRLHINSQISSGCSCKQEARVELKGPLSFLLTLLHLIKNSAGPTDVTDRIQGRPNKRSLPKGCGRPGNPPLHGLYHREEFKPIFLYVDKQQRPT